MKNTAKNSTENNNLVERYVSDICEVLGFSEDERPEISYDTSHFATATMMAQCRSDGKAIYIRKHPSPGPDYFFAIAHEMRHVWQIHKVPEMLEGYRTVDEIGTEDYNLQSAEIDAHAFAALVMRSFFRLRPQWRGMTAETISRIGERMAEIEESVSGER